MAHPLFLQMSALAALEGKQITEAEDHPEAHLGKDAAEGIDNDEVLALGDAVVGQPLDEDPRVGEARIDGLVELPCIKHPSSFRLCGPGCKQPPERQRSHKSYSQVIRLPADLRRSAS